MLPSGNDAAIALAIWGGKHIFLNSNSENFGSEKDLETNSSHYLKAFVMKMNSTAKQLQLINTRFGNPHGLPHTESRSTAIDVAKLTC